MSYHIVYTSFKGLAFFLNRKGLVLFSSGEFKSKNEVKTPLVEFESLESARAYTLKIIEEYDTVQCVILDKNKSVHIYPKHFKKLVLAFQNRH